MLLKVFVQTEIERISDKEEKRKRCISKKKEISIIKESNARKKYYAQRISEVGSEK